MAYPFFLVNAFTNRFEGGNPAAVVFLKDRIPDSDLANLAKNLNQPATAFLIPSQEDEADPSSKTFEIRWFIPSREIPLCGHASLAASGVIFSGQTPAGQNITQLHLKNPNGNTITAHKRGNRVHLSLPASAVHPVSDQDKPKVEEVVEKALGKKDVTFKFIGEGDGDFKNFLFVETEEDHLGDLNGDLSAFLGYSMHVITSASPSNGVVFQSRVFGKAGTIFEDPVCGSAHSLLTPYWSGKCGQIGSPLEAKQVSSRGGDLQVCWKKAEGRVTLGGEYRVFAKGEILL